MIIEMTQKRFIFNGLHIRDTLNEIPPILTHNDEQRDKFLDGLNKLSDENKELKEENQRLKEALLFFVDVANAECSSNWQEDMEKDCQKLFNCSYKEAQKKYDNYDSRWWELE